MVSHRAACCCLTGDRFEIEACFPYYAFLPYSFEIEAIIAAVNLRREYLGYGNDVTWDVFNWNKWSVDELLAAVTLLVPQFVQDIDHTGLDELKYWSHEEWREAAGVDPETGWTRTETWPYFDPAEVIAGLNLLTCLPGDGFDWYSWAPAKRTLPYTYSSNVSWEDHVTTVEASWGALTDTYWDAPYFQISSDKNVFGEDWSYSTTGETRKSRWYWFPSGTLPVSWDCYLIANRGSNSLYNPHGLVNGETTAEENKLFRWHSAVNPPKDTIYYTPWIGTDDPTDIDYGEEPEAGAGPRTAGYVIASKATVVKYGFPVVVARETTAPGGIIFSHNDFRFQGHRRLQERDDLPALPEWSVNEYPLQYWRYNLEGTWYVYVLRTVRWWDAQVETVRIPSASLKQYATLENAVDDVYSYAWCEPLDYPDNLPYEYMSADGMATYYTKSISGTGVLEDYNLTIRGWTRIAQVAPKDTFEVGERVRIGTTCYVLRSAPAYAPQGPVVQAVVENDAVSNCGGCSNAAECWHAEPDSWGLLNDLPCDPRTRPKYYKITFSGVTPICAVPPYGSLSWLISDSFNDKFFLKFTGIEPDGTMHFYTTSDYTMLSAQVWGNRTCTGGSGSDIGKLDLSVAFTRTNVEVSLTIFLFGLYRSSSIFYANFAHGLTPSSRCDQTIVGSNALELGSYPPPAALGGTVTIEPWFMPFSCAIPNSPWWGGGYVHGVSTSGPFPLDGSHLPTALLPTGAGYACEHVSPGPCVLLKHPTTPLYWYGWGTYEGGPITGICQFNGTTTGGIPVWHLRVTVSCPDSGTLIVFTGYRVGQTPVGNYTTYSPWHGMFSTWSLA